MVSDSTNFVLLEVKA